MKHLNLKLFLVLTLIILITFVSCTDKLKPYDDPILKLSASKTSIFPFEDIKISIDLDMDVIYANYDSIRWHSNGVAYSGIILGNPWQDLDDERDIRVTDYKIGKHTVYAKGYKGGKMISTNSIEYTVKKPVGDFLTIEWGKNDKDQYLSYTTGTTPYNYLPTTEKFKIGGVNLNFNYFVERIDREYATLQFIPWTFENNLKSSTPKGTPNIIDFNWNDESPEGNQARFEIEYEFLHNYLTELYGASSFIYEGEDLTQTSLQDEYAERFSYSDHFYPIEIWDTPTSYICISQANNMYNGQNQKGVSKVIAQPRNNLK